MKPHGELQIEDLTVLCDRREKRPPPIDLLMKTEWATLSTGDYSLKGLSHRVCVERKNLDDLLNCVGRERERFDRCIQRMRGYELAVLVIEAKECTVEMKQYRSQIHPNAVLGSVESWRAKGINIDWAGDQRTAALHISRMLFAFGREKFRELSAFYKDLKVAGREEIPAPALPQVGSA